MSTFETGLKIHSAELNRNNLRSVFQAEIGYLNLLKSNGVQMVATRDWLGEDSTVGEMCKIDDVLQVWERRLAQA